MILTEELCHIHPNRPPTGCLLESNLAGFLCEWMAIRPVPSMTASQTEWKTWGSGQWWWSASATRLCHVRQICKCIRIILPLILKCLIGSNYPLCNYWCKRHNIQEINWHTTPTSLAPEKLVCSHCKMKWPSSAYQWLSLRCFLAADWTVNFPKG